MVLKKFDVMKRPTDLSDTNKKEASAQVSPEQPPKDSNWIAEVSHELRLPIANIKLLVETLLDGALEDPDVCRRMLKRAYSEVERLQKLAQDLLSVEQVSQSRQEIRQDWVDLGARARYAAESVATLALSKGVEVRLDIKKNFRVHANQEQLDQVLLNLVENAVKFTPAGGLVTIAAGEKAGCFEVRDTGIGIPQNEIPKIFQRFYRVDRHQSKGSTGLGLSIVKNICDLHGGRVVVESEEGKGSTFRVEFPHIPQDW
jgi:two-component system, OmpR family, phosphate regulon sensor histidine kinase PhoR